MITIQLEVWDEGLKRWYKNGKIHRDNDQPAVIDVDGYKAWHKNGEYHRDNNLPAIIKDDMKWWYINGKYIKTEMSISK
jgi:starvation-inducible outer membrane lipoprotein